MKRKSQRETPRDRGRARTLILRDSSVRSVLAILQTQVSTTIPEPDIIRTNITDRQTETEQTQRQRDREKQRQREAETERDAYEPTRRNMTNFPSRTATCKHHVIWINKNQSSASAKCSALPTETPTFNLNHIGLTDS